MIYLKILKNVTVSSIFTLYNLISILLDAFDNSLVGGGVLYPRWYATEH